MIPLSKRLLKFFNVKTTEQEKELQKGLSYRLKKIIKPCWELKFCPYGPLVEDYPLPPLLISEHREHNLYLQKCLDTGFMGYNYEVPLDDERRKYIESRLADNDESDCVEKLSKFEKEASCSEFGHLCPAYFVSEPFTETSTGRNTSRNITNPTIIRVTRRDNNTCQVCGKILLDRDIEIDHIIPHSRGGTSDENNLRVTCLECNRKKGKEINL